MFPREFLPYNCFLFLKTESIAKDFKSVWDESRSKVTESPKKGVGASDAPEDEEDTDYGEEQEDEYYEEDNLIKEVVCSAFVKEDGQDQYIEYPNSLLRVVYDEEYGPRILIKTDDDELLGDVLIGEMREFSVSAFYFLMFYAMLD
jgi:hypothetical protein